MRLSNVHLTERKALKYADAFQFYLSIANRPFPVLLESVTTGTPRGRYSIVAHSPFLILRLDDAGLQEISARGSVRIQADPLEHLCKTLTRFKNRKSKTFSPGAIGFFSYDFGGKSNQPTLYRCPQMMWCFYDEIAVFDHELKKAYISSIAPQERIAAKLPTSKFQFPSNSQVPTRCRFSSNMTSAEYIEMIRRGKEYIAAGDTYEVNLCHIFSSREKCDPVRIYDGIRKTNPVEFAALLDFEDLAICSASPELFLNKSGRKITTRPIKGTVPANEDPKILLQNEKFLAELRMIIDLERNDLGRICEFGSVKVPELYIVEKYPTLYHLASNITGTLRRGVGLAQIMRATFPGGSVTGAPKPRTMEIISELEKHRRGIYTGSIGCLGFDGSINLSIAIRTLVISEDGMHYGAGGGIVWDSDANSELEETLVKVQGLRTAFERAGIQADFRVCR